MRKVTHLPLHPLFLAAFPVLFLFAQNREEGLSLGDLVFPLGVTLAIVIGLFVSGALLFRNPHAVAVVVSGWALLTFSYGPALQGLTGKPPDAAVLEEAEVALGVVWALLAVAVVLLARQLKDVVRATPILNVVGAVLVVMNLIPVLAPHSAAARPATTPIPTPSLQAAGPLRDIYYIVPDRFGSEESLRSTFGTDVRPFLRFLERKGFYVASDSRANYQRTAFSLAATLNMRYLDDVAERVGPDRPDARPLVELIQDSEVVRQLRSLGYRYVHVGSSWDGTDKSPSADVEFRFQELSEFSTTLYRMTAVPALARLFGLQPEVRRGHWERTLSQLDSIRKARDLPGPKFVFVHLLLPHRPYVFERDGSFLSDARWHDMSYRERYAEQSMFASEALRNTIEHLVQGPGPAPIIILQADEGPYPTGESDFNSDGFDWRTASARQLADKFGILNAYFFPGIDDHSLYPSVSPINSFRLLFKLYFGGTDPLLPDESFASELRHPYRFVNVTDRLSR